MTVNRLKGWATEVHGQRPDILDPETIASNLDAWMRDHNMSDNDMANETGYDRTYIFRLRKGERPITAAFKWNFLATFGQVPTNEIFYGRKLDPQPEAVLHGAV